MIRVLAAILLVLSPELAWGQGAALSTKGQILITQSATALASGNGITSTTNLTGSAYASGMLLNTTADGSGVNGPALAQVGLTIDITKNNWFNHSAPLPLSSVGEIDGLYIVGRQGGATSDHSGILVDVQNTGLGFLSSTELVSNIVDNNPLSGTFNTLIFGMDTQEGVLDMPNSNYVGHVYTAAHGALTTAVLVQVSGSATWANILQNRTTGGATNFNIDGSGNITVVNNITSSGAIAASTVNATTGYQANGTAGASCAANTVSLTTFTVTKGLVTHC